MSELAYLKAVRNILDHLENTQAAAIEKASDIAVESITNGGVIFCSGIGHGIDGDFLNRAGGLAAIRQFSFAFSINDTVAECLRDRPRPEPFNREIETVRFAVKASNLRSGDVMLVGSVSGKNITPVELSLSCREMGVKVIGFTSMDYTKQVEPLHPSGKKLYEAVDVVIDTGAPFGDAAVDIPGLDYKLLPVSGVASDVAGWMIIERVVEKMTAAGNPPTSFMSINREGGKEYYDKMMEQYNRRGY